MKQQKKLPSMSTAEYIPKFKSKYIYTPSFQISFSPILCDLSIARSKPPNPHNFTDLFQTVCKQSLETIIFQIEVAEILTKT